VLDVGCGAAIAAIAAARAGAREVVANDTDHAALYMAGRNAEANAVTIRTDPTDYVSAGRLPPVDVVLVADMFYHKKQAQRLLNALVHARAHGCRVIIADGQRAFAPREGVEAIASDTLPVSRDVEGVSQREVRLLELTSE